MLENKKAVIFDLDGTLVDSMWIWREIDIRFLGKYGLEVPQGLNDKLEGYSFHETAVYFKEHFPLPLTIEEIMGTWNRMASEIYIIEVRLKEGVKEFIELLKKRNMKLGIATSNSRKLAKDCLRSNGILDAFDYICTSDEVPRNKPEPDVYLHAAKMIDTFYSLKVPDIGKTTYNVGVIEGGTSVNTIAQNCSMVYEYRSHMGFWQGNVQEWKCVQ